MAKNTALVVGETSYKHLIGTPYDILDCWGVVRTFYLLEYGIDLKEYYKEIPSSREQAKDLVYLGMKDFERVEKPEYGDILLIKLFGIECHIAVYLGRGKILHTQEKTGCMIDNLFKWEKTVSGIFRVRKS
jgi:cell wall-associated NlpC family hydrolase